MEPSYDELANQNLAALGPVGITPGRFYFPSNPLNDPFIPIREVFEPNMPFVSVQELLQSPPNPSPQTSFSDPSAKSSDSEESFTFSTTIKSPKSTMSQKISLGLFKILGLPRFKTLTYENTHPLQKAQPIARGRSGAQLSSCTLKLKANLEAQVWQMRR